MSVYSSGESPDRSRSLPSAEHSFHICSWDCWFLLESGKNPKLLSRFPPLRPSAIGFGRKAFRISFLQNALDSGDIEIQVHRDSGRKHEPCPHCAGNFSLSRPDGVRTNSCEAFENPMTGTAPKQSACRPGV